MLTDNDRDKIVKFVNESSKRIQERYPEEKLDIDATQTSPSEVRVSIGNHRIGRCTVDLGKNNEGEWYMIPVFVGG